MSWGNSEASFHIRIAEAPEMWFSHAVNARTLYLAGLLALVVAQPTLRAIEALSREEIAMLASDLRKPETEMAALQSLVTCADLFLYEYGSMSLSFGNLEEDELRRSAARAVHAHRSVESVERALLESDRAVRFWAVHAFETIEGRREPWKGLLPRLQKMASEDTDAGIRSEAIEKLYSYPESAALLAQWRQSTHETDAGVLMRLLQFGYGSPQMRSQWYARAVKFLSDENEETRLLWLTHIWSNVWNPSTAQMWLIESDPGLLEALRRVEETGTSKEQELARKAVQALGDRAK